MRNLIFGGDGMPDHPLFWEPGRNRNAYFEENFQRSRLPGHLKTWMREAAKRHYAH